MRRLWRLLRLLSVTIYHTARVGRRARRLPQAERARYRAVEQMHGCALLCRILGIDVVRTGEIPAEGPTLAVCNHFGVLDPLVVASQVPVSIVGKAELKAWPLVGWITRAYGVVFVERGRGAGMGAFVERVEGRLEAGVPVLVFPEGTTFDEAEVQPFKTGAFATVAGRPDGQVLPLYLDVVTASGRSKGGRSALAWVGGQHFLANLWQLLGLRDVHMEVRVGAPLPVDGMDRKALAQAAHARVAALQAAA